MDQLFQVFNKSCRSHLTTYTAITISFLSGMDSSYKATTKQTCSKYILLYLLRQHIFHCIILGLNPIFRRRIAIHHQWLNYFHVLQSDQQCKTFIDSFTAFFKVPTQASFPDSLFDGSTTEKYSQCLRAFGR